MRDNAKDIVIEMFDFVDEGLGRCHRVGDDVCIEIDRRVHIGGLFALYEGIGKLHKHLDIRRHNRHCKGVVECMKHRNFERVILLAYAAKLANEIDNALKIGQKRKRNEGDDEVKNRVGDGELFTLEI